MNLKKGEQKIIRIMKYAFLTTLVPHQAEEEIYGLSKRNMQDAANALQWNIYNGLCRNIDEEIRIFNVLPIGSFPQYYKKPFVKSFCFNTDNGEKNINIGFCNVKLIRKYLQPSRIYKELNRWCDENKNEDKTLFVYTASAVFMQVVDKLKQKYYRLKVCCIIADLPDMSSLSSKKSFLKKIFEKHLSDTSYRCLNQVDNFVLLTRYMADYMHIDKPFTVMEGIIPEVLEIDSKDDGEIRTILYTGTLHKRFGILTLVEAFELLSDPNYRLVICGVGDSEDEIREAADRDPRIDFRGQVRREVSLKLQRRATVLVNPRQNIEEFTKYSFPSKTMEYLASGVPLIAYKLDGIPDEYDGYIFYVEDNSPEALAKKIDEVCQKPFEERKAFARNAQTFVKDKKNAKEQTKKIIELINSGD